MKLEQSLWQAGIYRRVSDVLLLMLLMFGAGAIIGAAMWQDPVFAMALGGGLAHHAGPIHPDSNASGASSVSCSSFRSHST